MATHSSVFAWRIPWTEEPGGLPVHGVAQEADTTWRLNNICLILLIETLKPLDLSQNSPRSASVLTSLFGEMTLFLTGGLGVAGCRAEAGLSDADPCCPQTPPSSGVGGRRELSQDEGQKKGRRSSL